MAARQAGAKLSNEAAQTAPGHRDRALAGLKHPNFELKMHTTSNTPENSGLEILPLLPSIRNPPGTTVGGW